MGAQRCKLLHFDNIALSVFLTCFFDEERTFLKDMSQKKKSNFSALEEKAEVFRISSNLLSGESGIIDQKEVTMISLSGSKTFAACQCLSLWSFPVPIKTASKMLTRK